MIPSLLTQPQELRILLRQRTFPITPCILCQILCRSLSQSFSPPSVFVWESFLPASSFVWLLTFVNGSLFVHRTACIFLVGNALYWSCLNKAFTLWRVLMQNAIKFIKVSLQGWFTRDSLLPAFNGKCF